MDSIPIEKKEIRDESARNSETSLSISSVFRCFIATNEPSMDVKLLEQPLAVDSDLQPTICLPNPWLQSRFFTI
jgi:hypothetical protein